MKMDRDGNSGTPLLYIMSRSSSKLGVLRPGGEFVEIGWFDFFQGEASEMGGE